MTTEIITLTIPAVKTRDGKADWLNANDTRHWAPRAKLVKNWRNLAHLIARQANAPKNLQRVMIRAEVHKTNNQRYDAHNLMPTLKPIVDGLVDYGLIPDDHNDHLLGPIIEPGEKRTRAGITLYITTLET